MVRNKQKIFIQIVGLLFFCLIAVASSSSKDSTSSRSSSFDWGSAGRGAAVGAAAGYNGYTLIGRASSESEARELAGSKGYSYYLWDSNNGGVYAK